MILSRSCNCAVHTGGRIHVFDANRNERQQKRQWQKAKHAEVQYGRRLRSIAEQVGKLVQGMPPDDPATLSLLEQTLRRYSEVITPWANSVASAMLADVARRDEAMWLTLAKDMGASIRQEIRHAPTGKILLDMQRENVALITSLPIEAAQRVHELAIRSIETSSRAKEISDEIMRTGEVTRSRADLIARTEVSRAASGLIEARATHIGSEGYIWRSSEDADVRNKDGNPVGSHRLLNGKFINWNEPPVAGTNGMRYHAGQGPRCRCWPEPVLPIEF